MSVITSRDNSRVRRWKELARDSRARREEKRALIEGDHLVATFLDAGRKVEAMILSESGAEKFGAANDFLHDRVHESRLTQ